MELEVSQLTKRPKAPPPRVKTVSTLRDLKPTELKKTVPLSIKKESVLKKSPYRFILLGLVFLSVAGMILSIITISRYDKLNKRLYQVSLLNKNKYLEAQGRLDQSDKITSKITENRNKLLNAYRMSNLDNTKFQVKENGYKSLLASKSLSLNTTKGDFRIASAQLEALKVQQELLVNQLKEKNEQVHQLTVWLLNHITEQEQLAKDNIKLSKECKDLKETIINIK